MGKDALPHCVLWYIFPTDYLKTERELRLVPVSVCTYSHPLVNDTPPRHLVFKMTRSHG